MVCVGEEIVNSFFPAVRLESFEEKLPTLLNGPRGILKRLEQISKVLAANQQSQNTPWFVGNNWIRPLPGGKDIVSSYTEIEAFRQTFEKQPEIQEYIESGARPQTTLPPFAGGLNQPHMFE